MSLNSLCLFTALCFGDLDLDKKHEPTCPCDVYRSEDGISLDVNHKGSYQDYQHCFSPILEFHSVLLRNLYHLEYTAYFIGFSTHLLPKSKFQHLIIQNYKFTGWFQPSFASLDQPISYINNPASLVIHSSTNIMTWWDVGLHFSHIYFEDITFDWNNNLPAGRHRWLEKFFVHGELQSFSLIQCPGCLNTLQFLRQAVNLKTLRLENSFFLSFGEESLRLPKLRIINLRNNGIKSIPVSLFEHFPSLEEIDLGGNGVLALDTYYDFSKLKDLNLPDNYDDCRSTGMTLCQFGSLIKTMFDSNNHCLKHSETRRFFSDCPHFRLTSKHLAPESKISYPKLAPSYIS